MSFEADITKFTEKTKIKGQTVLRKLALQGWVGCMEKSPVLTGQFRGNWNIGINTTDISVKPAPAAPPGSPGQPVPPSPGEISTAVSKIISAKWTDTIVISNNVPYAPPLEAGLSKQAPGGILRITVQQLIAHLKALVQSIP